MKIDDFFHAVVCEALRKEEPELNKRTGVQVRALAGVTFKTDLEEDGFPLLSLRKIGTAFIAEQMWFLSGSDDTEWLSRHTRIWDAFKDEDGRVSAGYGARWRGWPAGVEFDTDSEVSQPWRLDQLGEVVGKLRKDPSSRHGVVVTWDPARDLLIPQKNVPCPVMFTVNVIRGRLNMHVVVRSNDMVLGFPTDVAGFAFLQHILAQELGAGVGKYTHSISNAHIYENQMPAVEEMRRRRSLGKKVTLRLPENAYARASALEDAFLVVAKAGIEGYEPHPAITGIPIAL